MSVRSHVRDLPHLFLDRTIRWIGRSPRLAARTIVLLRIVPTRRLRAAVQRSLAWELARFLPPKVEVASVGGTMIVDSRDEVGRVVAIAGEWEPHVTNAFRPRLAAGDVCVDIGAHVGYYTLLASKLVGPAGHVYSFEPAPACLLALRENLVRNGVTNVTVFDVAAGAEEASGVLFLAPGTNPVTSSLSARMLETPHGGEAADFEPTPVRIARVDWLLPREAFARVRMIKVDVEGYEVEVLRGLEEVLAAGASVAVIVELSPYWSTDAPAAFVDSLCRRHDLVPSRLVNEYTVDGYFPARLQPPMRLERIPSERCDLLLERGAG